MNVISRVITRLCSAFLILILLMPVIGTSSAGATPFCDPIVAFNRGNFPAIPKIDNKFLPLVPGTQITLTGTVVDAGVTTTHTVIFTVTSLTKVLDGVNTVMVWDRDFDGSRLAEAELSFFAQDKNGNVWNLGEYPEEYDLTGKFAGAPSTWVSGIDGAVGGIHMLAQPKTGTGEYLQGWSPNIDFLDCAKVYKVNQAVCVPVKCFTGVLETSETSPLDQGGGHQFKFHAPGVGIVQIGAVGDPQAETLVLTRLTHLTGSALTNANMQALKLNAHGCKTNLIYSQTCG